MKDARAHVIGEGIVLELEFVFFSPPNFHFLFCTFGFQTLLRKILKGKEMRKC